jgi:hypothetical protein
MGTPVGTGPVVLVGCGRLGSAILEGWLTTGAVAASDLIILTPSDKPTAEAARAQGTTTNPSAPVWQVTYTFPAGTGTGAITESALDYQNSASAAILARQVFAAINKGAGDTLQMTWQIS